MPIVKPGRDAVGTPRGLPLPPPRARCVSTAAACVLMVVFATGCSRYVLVDPLVELEAATGDSLLLHLADNSSVEGTLVREDGTIVLLETAGGAWVPVPRDGVETATRSPRGAAPDRRTARRHRVEPGDGLRFVLADGTTRRGSLVALGEHTLMFRREDGLRETVQRDSVRRLETRGIDTGRTVLVACGVVALLTLFDDTVAQAVGGIDLAGRDPSR